MICQLYSIGPIPPLALATMCIFYIDKIGDID